MKYVTTISRILLGLLFTVFGLNGFLHFLKMPPPTGQLAGQYIGALFLSHYLSVVFVFELIGGLLLLTNRFVPLALVLLGPIVVNVLLFHSMMAPEGIAMALLATALWFGVFAGVHKAFSPLFQAKVAA